MKFIFNNKEYPSIDGVKKAYYGIPVPPGPDYTEPFYVENITNSDETLSIQKNSGSAPTITVEVSSDKMSWSVLGTTSTTAITRTITPGEKLYMRASANNWSSGWYSSYYSNIMKGVSKIGGNTMSLLYGSNFTGNETTFPSTITRVFEAFQQGNTNLKDASKLLLPATRVGEYCYHYMFYNCTSLTTAPELPATTLAGDGCYRDMFERCGSLTTAPELPATTLANYCYQDMFYGCGSLTTAPELPAKTLKQECYSFMFYNCYEINNIKCLATDISASNCLYRWVNSVNASGTFTKAAGVEWPTGESGIPNGWTVIEV